MTQEDTHSREKIWSIVSSIVGWNIWKARCSQVIGGETPSLMQGLMDIWSDIVHALMGAWGQMQGSSRAAESRASVLEELGQI